MKLATASIWTHTCTGLCDFHLEMHSSWLAAHSLLLRKSALAAPGSLATSHFTLGHGPSGAHTYIPHNSSHDVDAALQLFIAGLVRTLCLQQLVAAAATAQTYRSRRPPPTPLRIQHGSCCCRGRPRTTPTRPYHLSSSRGYRLGATEWVFSDTVGAAVPTGDSRGGQRVGRGAAFITAAARRVHRASVAGAWGACGWCCCCGCACGGGWSSRHRQ